MSISKVLFILALITTSLVAEVKDKWKVNVGSMYVTNFETDLQWNKKGLPVGVKINTNDQLGLESEATVFRFDGYYRFTDSHKIEASYFGVKSDGRKQLNAEINLNGKKLVVGTIIDAYLNMNIYRVDYAYSFYHNDKVELSIAAGLHITQIDLGYSVVATANNNSTPISGSSFSVTAPLPIVGFRGSYDIIPKTLMVNYNTDYFYFEYEDYRGAIISAAFSLEYRFYNHIGLGIGFNSNDIKVKKDNGNTKVDIDNRLSGIMVYMSYTY